MTDEKRYCGTVVWFDPQKGIGLILWEIDGVKQTDMFVHFSDLAIQGYKTLKKDQRVSFMIGENKKGQPKAINCSVLQ